MNRAIVKLLSSSSRLIPRVYAGTSVSSGAGHPPKAEAQDHGHGHDHDHGHGHHHEPELRKTQTWRHHSGIQSKYENQSEDHSISFIQGKYWISENIDGEYSVLLVLIRTTQSPWLSSCFWTTFDCCAISYTSTPLRNVALPCCINPLDLDVVVCELAFRQRTKLLLRPCSLSGYVQIHGCRTGHPRRWSWLKKTKLSRSSCYYHHHLWLLLLLLLFKRCLSFVLFVLFPSASSFYDQWREFVSLLSSVKANRVALGLLNFGSSQKRSPMRIPNEVSLVFQTIWTSNRSWVVLVVALQRRAARVRVSLSVHRASVLGVHTRWWEF